MENAAVVFLSLALGTVLGWFLHVLSAKRLGRNDGNFHPNTPLRESKAFLESIIENLPSMIFVKEAEDLRFVRFNRAGEELLGIPRSELIGKNDFDFFPEEQALFFTAKDRQVLESKDVMDVPLETLDTRKNGKRLLHTRKIAIRDERGNPVYLLGISEDVTERKKVEDDLQKAHQELETRVEARTAELNRINHELQQEVQRKEEIARRLEEVKSGLEEANRTKDYFLAALSHELRTPLTPVLLAASQMAKDEALPQAIRDKMSLMAESIRLEVRLIDDLLDLTRISKGKLELAIEAVDVGKAIDDAIILCQSEATKKNISLQVERYSDTPCLVEGDSARLQQVFWNLLKNGIKFTPAFGQVRARYGSEGNFIQIEISDTGEGIDPELQPKLFNAFEQGDDSVRRRFGGLGLGLSISKAIVERHGGTIEAKSDGKGKGATFYVKLPAAVEVEDRKPLRGQIEREVLPSNSSSILLVEDDLISAELLSSILRGAGHQVKRAKNVAEALDEVKKNGFDLLVSDIGLPDGSGLDVIKAFPEHNRPLAIALSGYGMSEDRERSVQAGFSMHLTKPVEVESLLKAINRLLSSRSQAREASR